MKKLIKNKTKTKNKKHQERTNLRKTLVNRYKNKRK